MKTCRDCGINKDISEFYVHSAMADGHLNKCKECVKQRVRKHRRENDSVREYDRERYHYPERKAAGVLNVRRWRQENPEKYAAQTAVGNAIRDGKLKNGVCEVCGSDKAHGHHDDYSRPLDVRWLCALHHHRGHAEAA